MFACEEKKATTTQIDRGPIGGNLVTTSPRWHIITMKCLRRLRRYRLFGISDLGEVSSPGEDFGRKVKCYMIMK